MKEMKRLGVWDHTPRLLGVQPEKAAPIALGQMQDLSSLPRVEASSIADSISVAEPHNWRKAVNAVAESAGHWITVSDEAIMSACKDLAAATGVFAEPAGAAAYAGILRARESGLLSSQDRVLQVVTGNGLKDVKGATELAPQPHRIRPSLDDVREAVGMK
jgi:threonine synthase